MKTTLTKLFAVPVALLCWESVGEIEITKWDPSYSFYGESASMIIDLTDDGSRFLVTEDIPNLINNGEYRSDWDPNTAFIANRKNNTLVSITSDDFRTNHHYSYGFISGDGSKVFGNTYFDDYEIKQPYLWTQENGISASTLPEIWSVQGISSDGKYAFGVDESIVSYNPYLWSEQRGIVDIEGLIGNSRTNDLRDISLDGTLVGERLFEEDGQYRIGAFTWNVYENIINEVDGLSAKLPKYKESKANYISDDSSSIVGSFGNYSSLSGGTGADRDSSWGMFVWNGASDIELVNEFYFGDSTNDGSIVVGNYFGVPAFWTASSGPVKIIDYLGKKGVSIDDLDLKYVTSISGDGSTVIGSSQYRYVNGRYEFDQYVISGLRLNRVPDAASTGMLFLAGFAGLFVFKRRLQRTR